MSTIYEIPIPIETPRFDFRIALGGRVFVIDVDYNGTEDRWYAMLSDSNGAPIAKSKIVCNVPLFRRAARDPRMPPGYLIALTLDSAASNAPPGWADLGRRVRVFYRG